MTYVREPTPHSHPCGICTRLGACSCDYPAVSTDFVCDACREVWREHRKPAPMTLTTSECQAVAHAILILRRTRMDAMADALYAILDRAVPS